MKKYILFCLSLLFVVSCNIIPVISEDEYALRQVFKMTGGAEWTNNDNWCGYRPVSEWYGVSADDGTVVGLDLSFNNLKGSFELYGMKSEPWCKLWIMCNVSILIVRCIQHECKMLLIDETKWEVDMWKFII